MTRRRVARDALLNHWWVCALLRVHVTCAPISDREDLSARRRCRSEFGSLQIGHWTAHGHCHLVLPFLPPPSSTPTSPFSPIFSTPSRPLPTTPYSQIVFPAAYSFQAVGKLDKISEDDFVSGVRGAVQEALSKKVLDSQVVVKPRMGGKYVSVKVTAVVGNAEDIKAAFGDIQKVPGCVMWF